MFQADLEIEVCYNDFITSFSGNRVSMTIMLLHKCHLMSKGSHLSFSYNSSLPAKSGLIDIDWLQPIGCQSSCQDLAGNDELNKISIVGNIY